MMYSFGILIRIGFCAALLLPALSINMNILMAQEMTGGSEWWPMYGHDTNNSGFSPSTVPASPTVLWEIPASMIYAPPGPAVLNGKVFAVGDSGLSCFDSVTGHEYWNFSIEGFFITGPVAAAGDQVYIGSQGGGAAMFCLDGNTGDVVWYESVPGGGYNFFAAYDPLIWNERLLFRTGRQEDYGGYHDTDGDLLLRQQVDGAPIWSINFGENLFSHPVLVDGKDLFMTVNGRLRKYDARNGTLVWELPGSFPEEPIFYDGRIYCSSSSRIFCLDSSDGSTVWTYESGGRGLPAVGGGKVYAGMRDGRFLCLDAETGAEIWARLYEPVSFSDVSAGIDKVLFLTSDNFLRCLDAGTGVDVWTFPLTGSYGSRPIAIADGRVYVSSRDYAVLCIGEAPVTVSGSLNCYPSMGTLPFQSNMSLVFRNSYLNQFRQAAVNIDLTLGGGTYYPNWRTGYMDIQAGESRAFLWQMDFPNNPPLVGENSFHLVVEDVTPAPYNQPPYPPAGDTCTDAVVVTGVSP